jgi:CheY-like chemotaxis protein
VDGLPKILLVEDVASIVEIYLSILNKHGYPVEVASTVDTALQKVIEFHPDIIFLDIMLPGGKTGFDALITLREDPSYNAQKTPIILLTNLGENEKIKELWEKYADGYVVKAEIDPHELVDIINSVNVSRR